jgi:hypothetical protein
MSDVMKKMKKRIKKTLEDRHWVFQFDKEKNVFHMGMSLTHAKKVENCVLLVAMYDNAFSVFALLKKNCSEERRAAAAEFIARVNYRMRFGSFEMDYNDGEVRFKGHTIVGDSAPEMKLINDNLMIVLAMVERYGNPLYEVMFEEKDPEEALEHIENE